MRTIFTMGFFWLYQIFSIVFLIKYWFLGISGKSEEQKAYPHKVATKWARQMIGTTFSKVEVIGIENLPESNVLYVANHQSSFDIPLFIGFLPKYKGFVAKVELEKIPILRGWMRKLGCIFLDRSNLRQSMQVILNGIEKLKQGETLVIFPEGTRSKSMDGKVDEFKKGSLQLAVKSGVPVVPVTIDGSFRMYEEFNKVRPAQVRLVIHPPIYIEELTPDEKKNLAEIVRGQIQSAIS